MIHDRINSWIFAISPHFPLWIIKSKLSDTSHILNSVNAWAKLLPKLWQYTGNNGWSEISSQEQWGCYLESHGTRMFYSSTQWWKMMMVLVILLVVAPLSVFYWVSTVRIEHWSKVLLTSYYGQLLINHRHMEDHVNLFFAPQTVVYIQGAHLSGRKRVRSWSRGLQQRMNFRWIDVEKLTSLLNICRAILQWMLVCHISIGTGSFISFASLQHVKHTVPQSVVACAESGDFVLSV